MISMTPVIVLIICKVTLLPVEDQNAKWTGLEKWEPRIENGELQCRREIVPVFDPAYEQGADEQPYTKFQCMRAGIMEGIGWNMANKSRDERVVKNTCPTPYVSGGKWKYLIPDCGSYGGVKIKCEFPEAI